MQRFCEFYYEKNIRRDVIKKFNRIIPLSSGINNLPCLPVIKNAFIKEYENDSIYTSYTDHCGNKLLLSSLAYEINMKNKNSSFKLEPFKNICRTFGGTGALSAIFEYFSTKKNVKNVLVLGLNYSLFSWWCEYLKFDYRIYSSDDPTRNLPTFDEVVEQVETYQPDLIILTQPTNPTGELYSSSELEEIVNYFHKKGIWLLYDDVTNMYNPFDYICPSIFNYFKTEEYPHKFIFVSSFSKSRSLAGMRYGYVIANTEICKYLYTYYDSRFWSTQNVGSVALSKDILYRTLVPVKVETETETSDRIVSQMLKMYRHWINILSPYAQDLTFRENNFNYIIPSGGWDDELNQYLIQLMDIYKVYSSNIKIASKELQPYIRNEINVAGGFNYCIKLNINLTEREFCVNAFEKAGIDFYTQSVFDKEDDYDKKDYYVRLSAAMDSDLFNIGIERFIDFIKSHQ